MTNVKALQIFQVLRQGSAILVAILLTKSILPTEDIGNFEMLLYIGTTISFFWVNGLVQGMLPLFPKLDDKDKKPFLFSVYILFLSITIFLISILYFGQDYLTELLVGKKNLPFFNLYCLYLALNIPSFLVEYFYLLNDRAQSIITFGVFAFGLHVVAVLAPIFLGFDFKYSFYGLIILAACKHLWILILLSRLAVFKFNRSLLAPYLKLSIPLMMYALLASFAIIFDQWLVGWFYNGDETTFAIFRYGARELPLALALTGAFSAAMIPELAKNEISSASLSNLKNKSRKLLHILFPISILLMLLSKQLFPIIFNDAFDSSALIFNVYLLVMLGRILFPQTILIAMKEINIVLGVSVIELIINIVLSFIFVYYFGLEGIAMASVLAFVFERLALISYLKIKFNISFFDYTDVRIYTLYAMLIIAAYLFTLY